MRLLGPSLLMLTLALAAGSLHADAASAAADYKLGQAQQAAKQWGPAAKLYLKVLQDDPQATYAYKALGTVYYQAGDKRGALAYYDRYLVTHPQDTATKAFADSLRASLGGAKPVAAALPRPRRRPWASSTAASACAWMAVR